MTTPYKDYHISLMHSNGTTAYETVFLILLLPLYSFITTLLVSLFIIHINDHKKWQYLLEFLFLIIPSILTVTILADYLTKIFVTSFVIITTLSFLIYQRKPSKTKNSNSSKADQHSDNIFKTNFLTNARAIVSIITAIAILAVDFKIFPRRFAKTESFGYSLMDTGVGLYIFSNGILAPEARGRRDSIKVTLKSSLPLFILGGARFLFVKQADYNVPVSEYGIHWNFFITLGFTKLFSSFILNIIPIKYIFLNAIFIIAAHEILLQTGLQKFALTNIKRSSFFIANKEGIISCLGYVSIYLFAVYFGYLLDLKIGRQNKSRTGLKYIVGTSLAFTLTNILQYYFGISRRLANSAYCFWIVFICILVLGLFYFKQIILEYIFRQKLSDGIFSPLILEAANYNGLVFFLLANVLTGLVNMSVNTFSVSNGIGLIILVLYMFVNCSVSALLYCKHIKLKL